MSDAPPKAGESEKATTDDKVNVLLALLVNALEDGKEKKEDEPAVSTLLAEGTEVSEPLLERLVRAVKAGQNSKQQWPSLPNDVADSRMFRKHKSAQSCIACKKFIDSAMSDGCENPKCTNPFAIHPDCIRTRLRNAKKLSIRRTGLLIVIGVALDTLQQIESHLLMRHYDGFLKKGRIRGRSM